MTFQPVPTANIVTICISLAVAFALPVALFILLRVKAKARVLPFFLGCISFVLFAMVLEPLLHQAVLGGALAPAITGNIWLYALYGGFAAGLFEETGRYVFLLLVMKKDRLPQNALMYGAGHGGIEAVLLLGMTYINNLVYSLMINAGQGEQILAALGAVDEATKAATVQGIAGLATTPAWLFLIAGLERVLAVTLHIELSVLIYTAIRKKKFGYAVLAFALHMLVDSATIVINSVAPLWAVELSVLVMVVAIGFFALRLYKQAKSEEAPPADEGGADAIGV